MDPTPMVDIVFQLIIFFLVAMQVKKNETEADLVLPSARQAVTIEDEKEPPLIINIVKETVSKRQRNRPYVVMGNVLDDVALAKFLKNEVARRRLTGDKIPLVRIRGDRDSQFKEIQSALIACRGAEIWQIRLSAIKGAEQP